MALSEKAKAMLVIKDMMPLQEWESFKKKLISEAVSPSHQDLLQVASGLEQLQAAGLVSQDELAQITAEVLSLKPGASLASCTQVSQPSPASVVPSAPVVAGSERWAQPSLRKNFKCAVICSPPQDTWAPIQVIRQKFDKAYDRWMPHINMMWPFVMPELIDEAAEQLRQCLAHVAPFKLSFLGFNKFEHAKSCVMFCQPTTEPSDALQKLANALIAGFPNFNDLVANAESGGFHPHLTVGQFPKNMIEKRISEHQANWKPIVFTVDCVYLISRKDDNEPFSIKHTIRFGGS